MTENQARRELVEAGRRLQAEGLVARSWGNLSLRLDQGSMAITPSGIPYSELGEEMVVVVAIGTGEWRGPWKPSGERGVHREIYLKRPDVRAIVHSHQSAASACAAARVGVPAPWGQLACAPYALPGTKTLASSAVLSLGQDPAVLLANHGVFAVGGDLDQAFGFIHALEKNCADHLEASSTAPLPARADSPWESAWLTRVSLADGIEMMLSRAPFTLAWAGRGLTLRASLDDLAQMAGPRVRTATSMPAARPRSGVLLVKGRGALVGGPDAEAMAMVLEKAARAAIAGEALGGAVSLPWAEAQLMRWVYSHSYAKQALKAAKA